MPQPTASNAPSYHPTHLYPELTFYEIVHSVNCIKELIIQETVEDHGKVGASREICCKSLVGLPHRH